MESEYSKLSIDLTRKLSRQEKKEYGIFFTPKAVVNYIIDYIIDYNFKSILEPSCGSGEFLDSLKDRINGKIDAIEYNKEIFSSVTDKNKDTDIVFYNQDYLEVDKNNYDLIIGNPPYFTVNKNKVNKKYLAFFTGRPNIYILFIIHSLSKLNDNGILAFVLPTNFLNCMYYNKLREYIDINYTILSIKDFQDVKYLETSQNTCAFIIKKKKSNNKLFSYKISNYTIFDFETLRINKLLIGSVSLRSLSFSCSIGKIVWNQHKKKLSDNNKDTLLLYNRNIVDNKLDIAASAINTDKKQYIKSSDIGSILFHPFIIVNRGYGTKYIFSYCYVSNVECVVENHLLVITGPIHLYNSILKSFNDNRTLEFINLYFKNGGINCVEMLDIFPIYMI